MKYIFGIMAIAFLVLGTSGELKACLNFYVVDNDGKVHLHIHYPPEEVSVQGKFDKRHFRSLERSISKSKGDTKFWHVANYCAYLIRFGRSKDVLPVLDSLLKLKPEEYGLHANLGVAYELTGQLEKALYHLNKSMQINSCAHGGSEWFHKMYLESAIKMKESGSKPGDFKILPMDTVDSHLKSIQITYQMGERVPLTPSANMMLAHAAEESGDYMSNYLSIEWSIDLYAIAIGYSDSTEYDNRLWKKIIELRERWINFKSTRILHSRTNLASDQWKTDVERKIKIWKEYTPQYYNGPIKNFN